MNVPEPLLESVKAYLDITWEDDSVDDTLKGMLARGMVAINNKGGTEFDYGQEGEARSLLFCYVMYERAGALNEFWLNYKPDIIGLQVKEEVRRYAQDKEQEIRDL